MESNTDNFDYDYERIFSVLRTKYDRREFDLLCGKLGIDSRTIKGSTHGERIDKLIGYCRQEGLIDGLIQRLKIERLVDL